MSEEMEVRIILPAVDDTPLVDMLTELTKAINERDPELVSHGILGGEYGYGARWENDVFLMHPYCWCEQAGECPWCTGCAIYQETKACTACAARDKEGHTPECYSAELKVALRSNGLWYDQDSSLGFEQKQRRIKAIQSPLNVKHGLPEDGLYIWHCDCGTEARFQERIDTDGCDYHRGNGIFTRFAPYTLDHARGYYDPPNFWHKPSNMRVTWYKYIGRDMVAINAPKDMSVVLADCLASLTR